MPTQCEHYWSGLRCQLWAGHASAHAAREDDAIISWRSEQHGDRVQLDWADQVEGADSGGVDSADAEKADSADADGADSADGDGAGSPDSGTDDPPQ
jgi:hypothetical protein